MDKALVLVGLLAIVIVFNWRAGRLATRTAEGRENAEELRAALVRPVRFLTLLIAPSFLAAILVAHWNEDPLVSGEPSEVVWPLVGRVFLGTALLMELVSRSAANRGALQEPTAELAGLAAMRGLFGTVAGRLLWAALGVAALFGGAADRRVAAVLAIDCALLAGGFALVYQSRRRKWESRAGGFSNHLDPKPNGGSNVTDLTRAFPELSYESNCIRVHDGPRVELGQRRDPPWLGPITQAFFALAAVGLAIGLVLFHKPLGALASLVAGVTLVAALEREKRRPPYRVTIDTSLRIVQVTPSLPGAQGETIPLQGARLEIERGDELHSAYAQLYLTVPETSVDRGEAQRRRLPLVDLTPYEDAYRAARALASFARLPLDRTEAS